MPRLSHHRELDAIRRCWRADNQTASLTEAYRRLQGLQGEFPYVLAIGHEMVLVLEKLGRVDEAIRKLRVLERLFKRLDEETLCRWGKLFKNKGNAALLAGDHTQAIHDYEEARRYYGRAFEVHRGFYPRINELTLEFLQAALWKDVQDHERSRLLLDEVRRKAGQMLIDTEVWRHRKNDDHVWVPATKGEASVLSQNWSEAISRYADAVVAARGHQFYLDCMRDQVKLLIDAYRRLGIVPEREELADPDAYFARRIEATIEHWAEVEQESAGSSG